MRFTSASAAFLMLGPIAFFVLFFGHCPGSGAAVRVPERCGELTRGSGNSLPLRGQISTLLF